MDDPQLAGDRETILATVALASLLVASDPGDPVARLALNAARADAEELGIPAEDVAAIVAGASQEPDGRPRP